MKKSKNVNPNISIDDLVFASQEQLKFMKDLTSEFMIKVMNEPDAWVSDRTYITDFEGADPKLYRERIIFQAKEVFEVDISPVYFEYLPIIIHFIATNKSKTKID